MGPILGQIVISAILLWGIYALISIGVTLIFGVLRIVNFGHGEFIMFGMYFTFWLFHYFGMDPYISILPVTFAIIIISIIAYKLVISKTMGRTDLPQIFATLGIGIVMQNLAYLFWSGNYRTVTTAYTYANITIGDLVINVSLFVDFL